MDTWLESVLTQSSSRHAWSRSRGTPGQQQNPSGAASRRDVRAKKEKTELCFWYSSTGRCPYGADCVYAHGMAQMRERIEHRRYKSRPCRNYHLLGTCPYGNKCQFFHESQERRRHMTAGSRQQAPPSAAGRHIDTDTMCRDNGGPSPGSTGNTSCMSDDFQGLEQEMQRVEDELRRFMW